MENITAQDNKRNGNAEPANPTPAMICMISLLNMNIPVHIGNINIISIPSTLDNTFEASSFFPWENRMENLGINTMTIADRKSVV